ncbi:MAG: acyl carrier protein [Sphingomonadales bacterium]|jgi:acyl carrier protein
MSEIIKKEEAFLKIQNIFADLFDLNPSDITPSAHLYDDLDIDSIDAVDLIVRLKEETGKKIDPEAYKKIRTVDDMVEAVVALMATP